MIYSEKVQVKLNVVISYSSDDLKLYRRLYEHLHNLRANKNVQIKSHSLEEISSVNYSLISDIEQADIFLPLISSSYLNQYTYFTETFDLGDKNFYEEYRSILEARVNVQQLSMIPIILKYTKITGFFQKFSSLPNNNKPVTGWPNRDEAWLNVVNGIELKAEEIEKIKKEYQKSLDKYEKKVEEVISHCYPSYYKDLLGLKKIAIEMGLKQQDSIRIESFILSKKEKEYKYRIEQYKYEFLRRVENQNPLNESSRKELDNLWKKLGLQKKDVESIEKEIIEKIKRDESQERRFPITPRPPEEQPQGNNAESFVGSLDLIKNQPFNTSSLHPITSILNINENGAERELISEKIKKPQANLAAKESSVKPLSLSTLLSLLMLFLASPPIGWAIGKLFIGCTPPPPPLPEPSPIVTPVPKDKPTPTPTPTITPLITWTNPKCYLSCNGGLSAKEMPTTTSQIIFDMPAKTVVYSTGETTTVSGETWVRIRFNEKKGWVPQRMLTSRLSALI